MLKQNAFVQNSVICKLIQSARNVFVVIVADIIPTTEIHHYSQAVIVNCCSNQPYCWNLSLTVHEYDYNKKKIIIKFVRVQLTWKHYIVCGNISITNIKTCVHAKETQFYFVGVNGSKTRLYMLPNYLRSCLQSVQFQCGFIRLPRLSMSIEVRGLTFRHEPATHPGKYILYYNVL